jgi:adenosylmethionine-8-amino-7-oxononanoate aminotransferase
MWCVQIGYGRREMAEAIADQVVNLAYNSPWGSTSVPAAQLAERLAGYAPGDLKHVFFTTGGSTAVDSALRFIMFYNNVLGRPEKKQIISRHKAYHGSTYLSATCSGKERDKSFLDFATHLVHHISAPDPYRRPKGMSLEDFCAALVKELEDKILELGPERVAAFVAEPILASGGVIVPPPGYHKACLEVCRKHGVLYLSDEVVTGFGRLGHMFASEAVFDIVPDIITFAKGVTSGYLPLGGFMVSDRLLEELKGTGIKNAVYSNGYTYSGHPVACAAALKNLDILEEEQLLGHVRAVAPYFQKRLAELSDLPIVGEVRGMGLMACVDCVADRESHNPLTLDREVGNRIDAHCQELGLLVRPLYNMCVMSPPLIVNEGDIDRIVELLSRGIEMTQDDLRREGLWQG